MPKARTRGAKKSYKLDVMSITVLLVMTLFGGLIGFYLGQSTAASQVLQTVQPVLMK